MFDSNFSIEIVSVVYLQNDAPEDGPRYVQVDAVFFDCDIRRASFYLRADKFNLKQIKKRCPWVYSYGSRRRADQELADLLDDFLESDLNPIYEHIILKKLPPDLDNIYIELRNCQSRLIPRNRIQQYWYDIIDAEYDQE